MTDLYIDAFVRESEEEITELNNSLLDLESDPDDRAAMDQIVRTAQTLTDNFGAMGFDDAADLAHAIEDLLDAIRQDEMDVTLEVMDMVFAGVDQIEAIVGEIEEHGDSSIETDEMVTQLRTALAEGTDGDAATDASGSGDAGAGESDGGETAQSTPPTTTEIEEPERNPLDQQRELMELLSQETRHEIVQFVLGHPNHLPSLAELQYMIGKTEKAIKDQIDVLINEDILTEYTHEANVSSRDLPHQFYGFSERGVKILDDYNYLKGLPANRAVYEKTRKNEKIERHESAPRPDLPEAVSGALEFDDVGE